MCTDWMISSGNLVNTITAVSFCHILSFCRQKHKVQLWVALLSGLLIFRGKKGKISQDFQGQIRGKIGWFRGTFAGRKSKFAEKSADFWYFCRKKVKIFIFSLGSFHLRKKKVKFRRIFRGKFSEKSADFTGNFGGETSPWNNQLKTADFAGFFWGNFTKIDQFCVDMTSVV